MGDWPNSIRQIGPAPSDPDSSSPYSTPFASGEGRGERFVLPPLLAREEHETNGLGPRRRVRPRRRRGPFAKQRCQADSASSRRCRPFHRRSPLLPWGRPGRGHFVLPHPPTLFIRRSGGESPPRVAIAFPHRSHGRSHRRIAGDSLLAMCPRFEKEGVLGGDDDDGIGYGVGEDVVEGRHLDDIVTDFGA